MDRRYPYGNNSRNSQRYNPNRYKWSRFSAQNNQDTSYKREGNYSFNVEHDRYSSSQAGVQTRDFSFSTDGGNSSSNLNKEQAYRGANLPPQQPQYDRSYQTKIHQGMGQKRPWGSGGNFGQVESEREIFDNKGFSGECGPVKQRKTDGDVYNDYNEQGVTFKIGTDSLKQAEWEEDEHNDQDEEDQYDEDNEHEHGGRGEGNEYGGDRGYYKVNPVIPVPEMVQQFKYFPPDLEAMKGLFHDLVVYFPFKVNNRLEKNPFVIICESFRRSERYAPLEIEDGFKQGAKHVKFCTIRWHGMMMVRGVGYSGNLKEPRVIAGVDLINTLAMFCYTLKAKTSYYSKAAVDIYIKENKFPDNMRVVQPGEAPNLEAACAFITNFFRNDNDNELFFPPNPFILKLKHWAKQMGYHIHLPPNINVLIVSLMRSPQYWRNKMIKSGQIETERFLLIPPQGSGKKLINENEALDDIPNLKRRVIPGLESGPNILYAPKNKGLCIQVVTVPWEQKGNRRQGKKGKKNKKKQKNKSNFGM